MCGLAGILLYPTERSEADWAAIRHCFSQTLIYNEERGREAAGVAIVQREGACRVVKQPVSASELVEMRAYADLLATVNAGTTCLLGHTRAPTKGSRWDNANNHPLLTGQVIGVHNGHIDNDDELFRELSLPRRGQVDSEIIFRLLDTIALNGSAAAYLDAVRRRAGMLRGPFSTLSVDLVWPGRLLALKKDKPLCVHYHEPWQALCFSSRYLFLRKAFGRSVITEALPSRHAYLFDAFRLPGRGKQPVGSLPL